MHNRYFDASRPASLTVELQPAEQLNYKTGQYDAVEVTEPCQGLLKKHSLLDARVPFPHLLGCMAHGGIGSELLRTYCLTFPSSPQSSNLVSICGFDCHIRGELCTVPTKSSLELGRRAGVDVQSIGLCTVPPARSSPYRVTSWNRRIRAAAA